jgi:SSS family solute:Na+ symporter
MFRLIGVLAFTAICFAWLSDFCFAELPTLQPELVWDELPPLPDEFGFGGPFAGVHNGALIVAGGTNFPDGSPWGDKPGKKRWHNRIYVLPSPTSNWLNIGKLPKRLAYGASISTDDGLILIGGEEDGTPVADVYRLQWNGSAEKIKIDTLLPPLPKAASYISGTRIGSTIYVAASLCSDGADRLDTKVFWALNLTSLEDSTNSLNGSSKAQGDVKPVWQELPTWPGSPRHKMVVVAQANAAGRPCVYLFGGTNPRFDPENAGEKASDDFFADAYRYLPQSKDEKNNGGHGQWKRIADMPVVLDERQDIDEETSYDQQRSVTAASGIAFGGRHVLIFSGATDRFMSRPIEDRPLFPQDVLAYNTAGDTWAVASQMLQGVATATAVQWGKDIIITSGEIRPGVRTPKVQRARLEPHFGVANWAVLLSYLTAMVSIGVYCSRRTASTEDFFLAGRRIPWWAAGLSVFGTQLSAITFMAVPATAYGNDWVRIVSNFTIMAVIPVVIWFYLPIFRRRNITTAYEYLELRFDVVVRLFGSTVFILFQIARMGIVLYLPAIALSAVTGMNVFVCIILMGILATIYTALGGIEAVIWTDVVQVIALIGGALVCIGVVVFEVGSLSEIVSIATANEKFNMVIPGWDPTQKVLWVMVFGTFFINLVPYSTDQAVVQRYLTTKSEKQAVASLWMTFWITAPTTLLFFGLGTALFAFYHTHPDLAVPAHADQIVPWFVVNELPAGVAGIVVAAIFAAAMSSLDSSMNSIATVFVTDFVRRFRTSITDQHSLRLARMATLVLGLLGTGIAIVLAKTDIEYMFDFFLTSLGLIGGPLAGIFALGIFSSSANARGVLIGALVAVVVVLIVSLCTPIDGFLYAAIGTSTCVAIGFLASRFVQSYPPRQRPVG